MQSAHTEHRLRWRDAVNLAAPHTWSASVMPCVFALAASFRRQGFLRPDLALCLFVIAVLMQSSVNALNDYADFVKGTDTADNSPDPTDAVIVYGLRRHETSESVFCLPRSRLACMSLRAAAGFRW